MRLKNIVNRIVTSLSVLPEAANELVGERGDEVVSALRGDDADTPLGDPIPPSALLTAALSHFERSICTAGVVPALGCGGGGDMGLFV